MDTETSLRRELERFGIEEEKKIVGDFIPEHRKMVVEFENHVALFEVHFGIECEKCGYTWTTRARTTSVTCPDCQRKTEKYLQSLNPKVFPPGGINFKAPGSPKNQADDLRQYVDGVALLIENTFTPTSEFFSGPTTLYFDLKEEGVELDERIHLPDDDDLRYDNVAYGP